MSLAGDCLARLTKRSPQGVIPSKKGLRMYFLKEKNAMKNSVAMVFAVSLLCSTLCLAQGLGSIVGTVTDKSGAAVNGAKITVVESDTGATRDAASDTQGYYVVPSLRPAQYSVSVRATGFSWQQARGYPACRPDPHCESAPGSGYVDGSRQRHDQ
jgi:carboxypeptidase family protein